MTTLLALYRRPRWRRGPGHVPSPLSRGAPAARRPDAGAAQPLRPAGRPRGARGETDLVAHHGAWTSTTGRRSTRASPRTRCAAAGKVLREIAPGLVDAPRARGRGRLVRPGCGGCSTGTRRTPRHLARSPRVDCERERDPRDASLSPTPSPPAARPTTASRRRAAAPTPTGRSTASRSSRSTGPRSLNALDFALLASSPTRSRPSTRDPACRAIVITGAGDRAFAAGADIKELAAQTPISLPVDDHFERWERLSASASR